MTKDIKDYWRLMTYHDVPFMLKVRYELKLIYCKLTGNWPNR